MNEYECAACGGIFAKIRPEAEALAELERDFAVPVDECEIVCDNCYREIMGP